MTTDGQLLSKIFEVTRGDLETAHFPFPQLGAFAANMVFVHVSRISRFWEHQESEGPVQLARSTEDLAAGFYGQSCPWMYLLRGTSRSIECWVGAAEGIQDRGSLHSSLSGAFSDIRFKDFPTLDNTSFVQFR